MAIGAFYIECIGDSSGVFFCWNNDYFFMMATPNKKRVLAKQVIHHSFETINKCMELAGAETYLRGFIGQKPRVDATEADQILIEALVKRGWISSYKADEDKYILYSKKAIAKV